MTEQPDNADAPHPLRLLALDLPIPAPAEMSGTIMTTAGFAELTADLLARVRPDHVLAPLFSPGHDAIAIVERLEAIGYMGQITVLSRPLPDARMVQSELRALGPGPRLTLLVPRAAD